MKPQKEGSRNIPTRKKNLWALIQKQWYGLSKSFLEDIVDSMPLGISSVIRPTKYKE
jgi:hypothetical protein